MGTWGSAREIGRSWRDWMEDPGGCLLISCGFSGVA